MSVTKNKTLEFTSEMKNMILVDNLVHEICSRHSIDEEKYGNILISLNDAVKNAIEHGNNNDPGKLIKIYVDEGEHYLVISVKDQGTGFKPEAIPDPTLPQNLEKVSGRGIHLMKNLCDKLEFEEDGTRVNLHFEI